MASESTVYWGHWWLPGEDPEVMAQAGSLTIEADHTMRLNLVGGFHVMRAEPSDGQGGSRVLRPVGTYSTILGRCGSEMFTLFGTHSVDAPNAFADRPERHTLAPQRALRGNAWLPDDSERKIDGIQLQLDYLLFFSQLTAFTHSASGVREDGKESSSGSVCPTGSLHAIWKDAHFELGVHYADFYRRYEDPNTEQLASRQRAVLAIRFDEPKKLDEADTLAKKIQDLLTLAVNRPCAVRETAYKVAATEPANDWERARLPYLPEFNVRSYGRQIYRPDTDAYIDPRSDAMFTVSQVPFDVLIPRWLDLYEKATVALQMLSGLRYLNVGYVTTRLTTVCVALEALHTSLYDRELMDPAGFKEFIKTAKSGFEPGSDLRGILRKRLRNTIEYRDRARDLAEKLDPPIVGSIIGDVDQWVDLVTRSRNDLAHANAKGHDSNRQMFLLLITQLMLCLVVGKELGLETEVLNDFAGRMWGWTSRWKEVTGQEAP